MALDGKLLDTVTGNPGIQTEIGQKTHRVTCADEPGCALLPGMAAEKTRVAHDGEGVPRQARQKIDHRQGPRSHHAFGTSEARLGTHATRT